MNEKQMKERQKRKDIAVQFREIAELFETMSASDDETKVEECAAMYLVKMMKIQKLINGM